MEEILFYFIREIRFRWDRQPINNTLHLPCSYIDIAFSRWDIAAEVCELACTKYCKTFDSSSSFPFCEASMTLEILCQTSSALNLNVTWILMFSGQVCKNCIFWPNKLTTYFLFLIFSFRGQTALHKAACYQCRTICYLLVEAGASLTQTDFQVKIFFLFQTLCVGWGGEDNSFVLENVSQSLMGQVGRLDRKEFNTYFC